MLKRSTIQLLRFHFSLFLLPVFLFGLSQVRDINWRNALTVFLILHAFVYPSSNGYNSYMDRDQSPIGGLANPLLPTKQLYLTSLVMDSIAILLSLTISPYLALGILLYIIASRAYSYRRIRLKQYPIAGFLTVFIFQGAVIFFLTYTFSAKEINYNVPVLPCITSSFLIGALYPLTQIYQHEEDKKDNVTTISFILGKRGTFIFSMCMFLSATFLLYLRFHLTGHLNYFLLFLLFLLPVVLFFLYWMFRVWHNEDAADFKNSLRMNCVSTFCTTLFFLTLIILNH